MKVGPAPSAHDRYRAVRHFGSLDGLRFLCIAAVIWHHVPLWQDLPGALPSRGHVGVDFFFVLSGYLITTLLLREEAAHGRFSLRNFYVRRARRILPIYLLVVAVAAGYAIGVKGQHEYLAILPFYLLFLSNFLDDHIPLLDPTWSLAIEEQYYLIWPALLLLVPRRMIAPLLVMLVAINVLAAAGVFNLVGFRGVPVGPLDLRLAGTTYAPILMGSLAALTLHRRAGYDAVAPWLGPRMTPWLLFAALLAFLSRPGPLEGYPNLVVHGLMTLIVMTLVVREDNGMRAVLSLPPIVRIGQISYGIYLYHLFALAVVVELTEPTTAGAWVLVLFMYSALTVMIAEISFRTVERHFLQPRPPLTTASRNAG